MKQNKYIIYALQDPITFELRYIGKSGSGLSRPKAHTLPSYLSKDDTHKGRWIKQLINNGFKPIIKVIQNLNNHSELVQAEIYWIQYFKDLGCPLTNSTKGGIGRLGLPHTEETKKKIGLGQKNRKSYPRGKDHVCFGRKLTDEFKTKISKATKLAMTNPEIKNKINKRGSKFIDNHGNYYESTFDAQRKTGLCRDSIRDILDGKKQSVKGYKFEYIIKSSIKIGCLGYNKGKSPWNKGLKYRN